MKDDAVMEEVYDNRRKLSGQHGNDATRYIRAIRDEVAIAAAKGMSYVDYCLSLIEGKAATAVV